MTTAAYIGVTTLELNIQHIKHGGIIELFNILSQIPLGQKNPKKLHPGAKTSLLVHGGARLFN